MSSLQGYNPFGGNQYLTPSQVPEIFLKTYTVSSGVASFNISDPAFRLDTYKTIHIRINNLNNTTSSGYIGGGPYKNNAIVSGGAYAYSVEGISTATATGWAASTTAPSSITNIYSSLQLTPSSLSFLNGIGQIDIYLTRQGMTFEMHTSQTGSGLRRLRSTVTYPTIQTNPLPTDYFGLNLGLSSGTFTGGTVNVYGVQ